ncbi:MAG TPA: alkaline phosphatase D family protein [Nocardioidaceae bacterium]|nr:alkaline phosphatase D family protein [Nocardioidaceae bacterium]
MPLAERSVERRHVLLLAALIVAATVVSTLAVFANPPADEWLYLELRGVAGLSRLEPFDVLRSPAVVGALALLGVVAWRCRTRFVAAAIALLGAFTLAVVLGLLAGRERPFDSTLGGDHSFPSPSLAVLAAVAVLVPTGLQRGMRSRAVPAVASAALWAVVVVAGLQEVYAGLRWPFDVLGGVLIGATAAVATLVAVNRPTVELASPRPGHRPPMLHRPALAWSLVLALSVSYLVWRSDIPRLPGSTTMGTALLPLAFGSTALVVAGVLVAVRHQLAGAVTSAVGAALLGYCLFLQLAPGTALVLAVTGFVPAVLVWWRWQAGATDRRILTGAVSAAVALGILLSASALASGALWGRTHPRSATPPPETDEVEWMWAGAVTDTSVTVKARTVVDHRRVRLVVAEDAALSSATYSPPVPADSASVVSLTVTGLEPDEEYHYALELDGKVEKSRTGTFSTFPRGPASFTFAVSSCARTGSDGSVFDAVRRAAPLLYLNAGDWFYGDIGVDDVELFRRQYEANLTSPSQAALYASTAFAYVWDDHDSTGNDADASAASWPAAMRTYRDYVPHYELADGPEGPIYQAFTVGDVRFVMTDPRSARDRSAGTMLGEEQRKWLIDQFASASDYGLVVWVNGSPWVGKAEAGNDTWAGFAEERRVISNAIADNDVDNLLSVSGDAHMLAYDDGTHTDYSDSGGGGFPLFQVAALDRRGSIKGGPYSGPVIPGGGQFGLVRVDDDGRTVRVTMEARNWRDEVLFTRTFEATRD